jgi:hypothetical protein
MSDPASRPAPAPSGPKVAVPGGAPEADLARRRFFRQFAGELVQTAATVMGAASVLQRTSAEAAASILDPDAGAARMGAVLGIDPAVGAPTGFRTPFRWDGDRLLMIDQRRLPGELVEYEARSAADVAYAIRDMIIRGAPAIGQVAAIGLALSAARLRTTKPYARRASLRTRRPRSG